MKKLILATLLATLAGAASATTYSFSGGGLTWSPTAAGGSSGVTNFNATLNIIDSTGSARFVGSYNIGSSAYHFTTSLMNRILNNATHQTWNAYTGTVYAGATGNTVLYNFRDYNPAIGGAYSDATLAHGSGNSFSFGMWSYLTTRAGASNWANDGTVNGTCTSGYSSATNSCTTTTGNVPVPGSLPLLALGLLALGVRRFKKA
jgi:uncharacterized protein (TIGR03382 family)